MVQPEMVQFKRKETELLDVIGSTKNVNSSGIKIIDSHNFSEKVLKPNVDLQINIKSQGKKPEK